MEKKCGRLRQATDDNRIRRMYFACWITKVADTNLEYVMCSSIAIVVTRTHLSVTSYVQCLSCVRAELFITDLAVNLSTARYPEQLTRAPSPSNVFPNQTSKIVEIVFPFYAS